MRKKNKKPVRRKTVRRLPDLDHAKTSVLNSLSSPRSRRNYKFAMEQFITRYCSESRSAGLQSSKSARNSLGPGDFGKCGLVLSSGLCPSC
jgi:hypothetical protein